MKRPGFQITNDKKKILLKYLWINKIPEGGRHSWCWSEIISIVLCFGFSLGYSFCLRICRGVQLAPLCAREVQRLLKSVFWTFYTITETYMQNADLLVYANIWTYDIVTHRKNLVPLFFLKKRSLCTGFVVTGPWCSWVGSRGDVDEGCCWRTHPANMEDAVGSGRCSGPQKRSFLGRVPSPTESSSSLAACLLFHSQSKLKREARRTHYNPCALTVTRAHARLLLQHLKW